MTQNGVIGRRRTSWSLFTALAVDATGTGLYMPLALLFFLQVTDMGVATIGLLVSVANLFTLPLPLLVGSFVDRFGAKTTVVTGQATQGVGFLLHLLVFEPISLTIAVLVVGVGGRMYWTSIFTLIADIADTDTGHSRKDQWFARASMIRNAGMGGGALLAGTLLVAESEQMYRMLTLSTAIGFCLAAMLTAFLVRVGRPQHGDSTDHPEKEDGGGTTTSAGVVPRGYRSLLGNRPYLTLVVANTGFALCSVFLGVSLPVYATQGLETPSWTPGVLLAVNIALLATTATFVTSVVRRRLSRTRAMAFSGVLWMFWAAGLASAALLSGWWLLLFLLLVTLCYTLAELVHEPASNALAAAAAPRESRGSYLAVFQYSFTLAHIVAPGLFAVLFSLDRLLPWLAMGLIAAAGTAIMLAIERKLPQDAVRRTEQSEVATTGS